ncbi:hypothetical protein OCU04_010978 [Sclerotinia nivalis]|uniref:Uncharacterized protein n=1 Tax=Sclerotinia nivalis TaxID=352851 RepID=A0A9X0ADB0_9HELO|nr:hypothetical protein OCU04_010978 [Sclerotinia nivalis]
MSRRQRKIRPLIPKPFYRNCRGVRSSVIAFGKAGLDSILRRVLLIEMMDKVRRQLAGTGLGEEYTWMMKKCQQGQANHAMKVFSLMELPKNDTSNTQHSRVFESYKYLEHGNYSYRNYQGLENF